MRESVHSARPVHPLRNVHSLTPVDRLFVFLDCLYVTVPVKVAAHWHVDHCFKLNKAFCDRESRCPRYVAFQGHHGDPADEAEMHVKTGQSYMVEGDRRV